MDGPLVSVVIPTYNRERVLPAAIESVCAQTYANWELLIVDDGSVDGTALLIEGLDEPRLRHVHLRGNSGSAAARNAGVDQARGDYVAFLDSDDTWRPEKLREHMDFVRAAPNARQLSCTAFTIRDLATGIVEVRGFPSGISRRDVLYGCFFSPGSTLMAERRLFDQVGPLDTRLRRLEDWDWLLRATVSRPLSVLNRPLSDIAVGPRNAAATEVEAALALIATKHRDYALTAGTPEHAVFRAGLRHELAASRYHAGHYFSAAISMMCSLALHPSAVRSIRDRKLSLRGKTLLRRGASAIGRRGDASRAGRAQRNRRAVFLDRDGVLNRSNVRGGRPYAPTELADFEILPGAPDAVARLRGAGYLAIVVTNQKDVGQGIVSVGVIDAMHDRLRAAVALDDMFVCTCVDECPCYKPNPGMLLEAAEKWGIDLAASYMVGDRWRDVGAGRNAGCFTILVDRGYAELLRDEPDRTVASLDEAADLILCEDPAGDTAPVGAA